MRNLTKVLALVLAFAMMISGAAFAASYTDVEASANYAEAVSVLSDLGLVKGYEDGTFGADNTLTRAEAATLVVRLMNLEDAAISAAGSDTGFTDVPADHWASGYIYIAAQKEVVAGMGDGTFEPETELEYAQIVKMITVALGYAPQAAEAGEWPGNYISTASNIGLTKGIPGKATDKASRGLTARLLYAALTIPKMEKNGVGVNATFEPVNKMILDELAIYKLVGKISSVDAINDKAVISIDKQGLIIDKKYKETADTDDWSYDSEATNVATGALTDVLKDMKGVPAYIYVQENDGEYVVAAIVERKNVSSASFTSEDIEEYTASKNKLSVYTNVEQTKTTSYKLADDVTVRINGGDADEMDHEDFAELIMTGAFAIDLKDTVDSDDIYDYANLVMYKYMVVDEVKANKQGVYSVNGETLTIEDELIMDDFKIDTDNDDTAITIIKDGEVVDVDAIEEGDILNVVVIEDDGDELIEGTIYVTNEKVDAVVRYVDTDEESPVIAMADGSSYKYLIDVEDVESQMEATFFLNISGKIIYVDNENSKSAYNYGFATNIVLNGKNDTMKTGTIRVLTTEGEWKTLDLKSTFTFNGDSVKISDVDVADFADNFEDYAADSREPEFAILDMVAYKLDSTGAVKEIVVVTEDADLEDNKFDYAKTFKNDGEEATFGSFNVDETTVVYNVSDAADMTCAFDEKDVTVTDISILKDDTDYTANLYNINEKTDLVAIIKGSFIADVDFEAPLFIVSKVLAENIDEKDVVTLIGFEAGEEKTYYVSQDDESEVVGKAVEDETLVADDETIDDIYAAAGYTHGDVMIVNADANGIIAKAVVLGNLIDEFVVEAGEETGYADIADIFGAAIAGDDNGKVVKGFVAEVNGKKTAVWLDVNGDALAADTVDTDELDNISIKGASVTVFDVTQKKANRISAGSTKDIAAGTVIVGRVDEDDTLVEAIVIITDETDLY